MTESKDDDVNLQPITVDRFIADLVEDFGKPGESFNYVYWAEQIQIGLRQGLPGYEPHDPLFWSDVIAEMRGRG